MVLRNTFFGGVLWLTGQPVPRMDACEHHTRTHSWGGLIAAESSHGVWLDQVRSLSKVESACRHLIRAVWLRQDRQRWAQGPDHLDCPEGNRLAIWCMSCYRQHPPTCVYTCDTQQRQRGLVFLLAAPLVVLCLRVELLCAGFCLLRCCTVLLVLAAKLGAAGSTALGVLGGLSTCCDC